MKAVAWKKHPGETAQTMVEFALVLPFLLILILGVTEVGRLLFIYSAVTTSSREAARYGSAVGENGGAVARYRDCSGMRSAARRMGALVGIRDADILINYIHHDPDTSTDVTIGSCPVGGTGPEAVAGTDRVFVQVSAVYQPLFALIQLPWDNQTLLRPFTVTSYSRRTILKDVSVVGTPPAGSGSAPKVQFALESQSAAESAVTASILVQLVGVSTNSVVVPFSVSGTAIYGQDHSLLAGSVTIPAGSSSATITVDLIDDGMDEFDEQIVVTLGDPSYPAVKGTPITHVITLLDDDDPPTVAFTHSEQSRLESAGTLAATVQLSAVSGKDILVPFTFSSTATEGSDYTITASPLTIPAGSASIQLFISVTDDSLDEEDEAVVVSLAEPVNATQGSPSVHTAWITDDDTPPLVRFTWENQSAAEGTETIGVKVELSAASGRDVTVPIQVSGSAVEGLDYTVGSTLPLVIPAGQVSAEIMLAILSDLETELDETVILAMDVPVNAVLGAPATHTLTITNLVPVPVVAFTDAAQSVTEDAGSVTIVAQLNAASLTSVTVPFTVGGTAQQGSDTSLSPAGQVTIPAGSASAAITVYLTDDTLDEESETVIVTMGTPANATKGSPSVHTVTIVDNDTAVVAFAASGQEKREDLGAMTVTVQLSMLSTRDVSVPFSLAGTAGQGSDYTATASPIVIPAGNQSAAITLNLLDDTQDEDDETAILTLGTPTNAVVGSPTVHTATIIDNDSPVCDIFDDNELVVNKSGKLVSWSLYNQGTDTLVLSSLTIVWPSDGSDAPKFDKTKFNTKIIWDGNIPNSPASISSWMGMTSDRTLIASPITVALEFTRALLAGDYQLTLNFRNVTRGIDCPGVSASYTSP